MNKLNKRLERSDARDGERVSRSRRGLIRPSSGGETNGRARHAPYLDISAYDGASHKYRRRLSYAYTPALPFITIGRLFTKVLLRYVEPRHEFFGGKCTL